MIWGIQVCLTIHLMRNPYSVNILASGSCVATPELTWGILELEDRAMMNRIVCPPSCPPVQSWGTCECGDTVVEEEPMDDQQGTPSGEWGRKDATLSDSTARKEYGLTQAEIVHAIRLGQLQCREGSAHGNPFLRLLCREVEALVVATHGATYLKTRQVAAEVQKINKELKKLKAQVVALEARRSLLLAEEATVGFSASAGQGRG